MKIANIMSIAALLLTGVLSLKAQVLSNQVINSAGDHRTSATLSITLTDNVGEPFTETYGPVAQLMITQGFLQPEIYNGLTILKNHPTCVTADNGFIRVIFSTANKVHSEQYVWSPT